MMPTSAPTTNSIGQRLHMEMKKRGLTSTELARRADVKTSFLYDVISGKSANPSTLKLARVAEAMGVSLNFLAGRAEAPSLQASPTDDFVAIPRLLVDVSASGGAIITEELEGERYRFRHAWIKDRLGATPADLRMLYVRGDSMEPTLCHNDIVLIDTAKKTPSPPGIFVLFDGMGLVAKRVEYVGAPGTQRIRIGSDNPQYATYERSSEESFIAGRVVWFAREI